MSGVIMARLGSESVMTDRLFNMSVRAWFGLAAIGHWIFLVYLLMVFFPPVAQHGLEGLKGMHLPSGFKEGDTFGNLAAVAHVLLATIVIGGGPLQLMPAVRSRFPSFHRSLGHCYLLTAVIMAIGGLYLTWSRSPIGDQLSKLSISGDAVLIILFAYLTVINAMARRLDQHRRWAMRLFMAASAVWFFRVGLMGWAALTGGVGIDWESFTGPFLNFLGFADYLLPLAMLEWYFFCQKHTAPGMRLAFTATLSAMTLFMAVGIFAATAGMWLPLMK